MASRVCTMPTSPSGNARCRRGRDGASAVSIACSADAERRLAVHASSCRRCRTSARHRGEEIAIERDDARLAEFAPRSAAWPAAASRARRSRSSASRDMARGERRRVVDRHEQPGLAVVDQRARAVARGRDDRRAAPPRPRSRHCRAARGATGRRGSRPRRAAPATSSRQPRKRTRAVNAERMPPGARSVARSVALAGEPEMKPRHLGERGEQHIEALVRVEPAERQRRAAHPAASRALPRAIGATAARHGKIGQIVRPLRRPALAHQIGDDIARVADEMIAAPVIFQIVITPEARNMDEIAARAKLRRAVHPGQHDARPERRDGAAKAPRVAMSRAPPNGSSTGSIPPRRNARRAVGVAADHDALRLPRPAAARSPGGRRKPPPRHGARRPSLAASASGGLAGGARP